MKLMITLLSVGYDFNIVHNVDIPSTSYDITSSSGATDIYTTAAVSFSSPNVLSASYEIASSFDVIADATAHNGVAFPTANVDTASDNIPSFDSASHTSKDKVKGRKLQALEGILAKVEAEHKQLSMRSVAIDNTCIFENKVCDAFLEH